MKVLVYYMFIAAQADNEQAQAKLEAKRQELINILGAHTKIIMIRTTVDTGGDTVETLELDGAPTNVGMPFQPTFFPTTPVTPITGGVGLPTTGGTGGFPWGSITGTASALWPPKPETLMGAGENVIDATSKFTGL